MTAVIVEVGSSSGMTMSMDGDDQQDDLGDENETSKRSERKRQREKQRRFDLSNAFDELSAFIVQIEPESLDADGDAKKKRRKSTDGPDDSSGITRLDLIGRALRIMKRLHRENEQNKRMIATMRERERTSQPNDNVLVMLPTLTPAADEQYPVARATYPSYPPTHPPYYQGSHVVTHVTQQPPQHPPPEYSQGGGGMVHPSHHHHHQPPPPPLPPPPPQQVPQYHSAGASEWARGYSSNVRVNQQPPPPPPPSHSHPHTHAVYMGHPPMDHQRGHPVGPGVEGMPGRERDRR